MLWSFNFPEIAKNTTNKKLARKGVIENTIELASHTIHYYEGGEGETILFLHGFGGDAQVTWKKPLYHFSQTHNVVAPDLLWFGTSRSEGLRNLKTQVDAMIKLLGQKERKKVTVVGISYGGFVAIAMAYLYPEIIDQMVIVDSPGITYDITLLKQLSEKMNVSGIADLLVPKNPQEVLRLLHLACYKNQKIPKGVLEDLYVLYFESNHTDLIALITSLKKEQKTFENASREDFPRSLVIWGEEDEVFPLEEGQKLATYLGAPFRSISKAGHAVNIE